MNRRILNQLTKESQKKFPLLNLTAEDLCKITMATLLTLARGLRKKTNFSSARLLEYAGKAVGDFLKEEAQ